jgi:hypothetical protein
MTSSSCSNEEVVAVADSIGARLTPTIESEKPNNNGDDDVEKQPRMVAGRCSHFDRSPKASGPRAQVAVSMICGGPSRRRKAAWRFERITDRARIREPLPPLFHAAEAARRFVANVLR